MCSLKIISRVRIIKCMETVRNTAEAEAFFAANAGAEVICENDSKVTKVVSTLEDASAFFDEVAGEGESTATAEEAKPESANESTGTDAGDQGQVAGADNQG